MLWRKHQFFKVQFVTDLKIQYFYCWTMVKKCLNKPMSSRKTVTWEINFLENPFLSFENLWCAISIQKIKKILREVWEKTWSPLTTNAKKPHLLTLNPLQSGIKNFSAKSQCGFEKIKKILGAVLEKNWSLINTN